MQTDPLAPIDNPHIIRQGRLNVGDGHALYWVDWGNPAVTEPIFYLHGGPGSGFDDADFDKFDPAKHRVIFHDQRGSGRSTPFAGIEHNTTDDLIQDIEKLRAELGFAKVNLYGISWGSTLALCYAIEHAKNVGSMLIGGIFLARQQDNDYYLGGGIATHFPEVWEQFCSLVPASHRSNVSEYYKQQLFCDNEATRKRFAKAWMLYESSILKLDYEPARIERDLQSFASESLAYLEAHYILNGCFMPENHIIANAAKLRSIPKIIIVQGRYDFICPPSGAYALHKAIGGDATLHIVQSGHSPRDIVQREALHAYISMLWGQ